MAQKLARTFIMHLNFCTTSAPLRSRLPGCTANEGCTGNAPSGFVKKRWEGLVFTETGVDRRFYELCVLSELKNALRSGDIWVQGSRQFKDFAVRITPTGRPITVGSSRIAISI
jgi:hypothetical protein